MRALLYIDLTQWKKTNLTVLVLIMITKNRTPLTHQRFLNRHRGSYGPAIRAGEASFPFPGTPVDGLLVCGDSVFPGIGVPGK